MHPLLKLWLAFLALSAFIALVCVIWMDSLTAQLVCFGLLSLGIWLRWSLARWLAELKVLAPFIFTLLLVYLIFGLFGVHAGSGARENTAYWLRYGLCRVLLLVNSVLAVQVLFSLVNFDDVLRLPLGIAKLKYVILGKLLYAVSFSSHRAILFHQALIPVEQATRKSFKHRFRVRLASLLALLYYIVGEARLKGELIDNRIAHCHPQEKS